MSVRIDDRTYCCGTCAHWRRALGCTMPATPSTVNCGRTTYDQLCEQWTAGHAAGRSGRTWKVRKGKR